MDELVIPRIDNFSVLTDADAQRVRTIVLDKLAADSMRYLSEYSERFDNVLNADDAATLFEEYNEDRARYRVAVHPAATWVRDELFRRAPAKTPVDDTDRVVFTAGSNAAGESSAIAYSQARRWAHVVLDSTFSDPAHARRLVDTVLGARWPITVLYIGRTLEEAFLSMLDRSRQEGRVVGIGQMIHSHRGAAETVRGLANEFRRDMRCDFHFFANSMRRVREVSIELTAPQDYSEIRINLHELPEAEYRAGRITKATYDRVRGWNA